MCAEMKITMENYFDRILENKKIPKQIKETVCSEMHHALEVSNMAVLISKELGKDKQFRDDIAVAGVLHDIGKLRGCFPTVSTWDGISFPWCLPPTTCPGWTSSP